MASGRLTSYKPEYDQQAYKLCLLGAKDTEIAHFFNVSEQTITSWKKNFPSFLASLKDGKENADAVIAQSLYHRAKGYEHKETITASYQGQITDSMEVIKHYPPDTVAAIFWLKNRQPQYWRDKQTEPINTDDLNRVVAAIKSNIESTGGDPNANIQLKTD